MAIGAARPGNDFRVVPDWYPVGMVAVDLVRDTWTPIPDPATRRQQPAARVLPRFGGGPPLPAAADDAGELVADDGDLLGGVLELRRPGLEGRCGVRQ